MVVVDRSGCNKRRSSGDNDEEDDVDGVSADASERFHSKCPVSLSNPARVPSTRAITMIFAAAVRGGESVEEEDEDDVWKLVV